MSSVDSRAALTAEQVAAALAKNGLTEWGHVVDRLEARFLTRDWEAGMRLLSFIAAEAQESDHHPDLDLRLTHLDVHLTSHDVHAVTARDLRLAQAISEFARGQEVSSSRARLTDLVLILHTPDAGEIRPFWQCLLGYDERGAQLRDPHGSGPTICFAESVTAAASGAGALEDSPAAGWRLEVWVPVAVAKMRVDAAVAAGGVLLSDADAPSAWLLADPQGNRARLCTSAG